MPTYNHSRYIAEAIESFLMQETHFRSHLYISDDASTDATTSIAEEYATLHPDAITLIKKERNDGLMENYRTLLNAVQEDYIAILESDDYWTNPLKLQMQYNLMEQNQDYGLTFTRCRLLIDGVLQDAENVADIVKKHNGELYSYLLLRALIWSPTIMFRRSSYQSYCSIAEYIELGFKTFDAPLILSIAANKKIGYIEDFTAVYRIQPTSISNTNSLQKRLAFEHSSSRIKSYVISKYGTGTLSMAKIRLRELIIYLRIIWRTIF